MSQIAVKIRQIHNLMAGKFPHAQLVVVTKSRTVEEMKQAITAGAQIIAENRVQEANQKFPLLPAIEKHLIGHLQSNKAKEAVQLFDMIQSVDSTSLAEKINEEAGKINKVMPVLLQINISADEQKYGFSPAEIYIVYEQIQSLKNVSVRGLMTITKDYDDPALVKQDFQKMKTLFDEFCASAGLQNGILSMGMSNDFELALECGSTMIRVGSYIFN